MSNATLTTPCTPGTTGQPLEPFRVGLSLGFALWAANTARKEGKSLSAYCSELLAEHHAYQVRPKLTPLYLLLEPETRQTMTPAQWASVKKYDAYMDLSLTQIWVDRHRFEPPKLVIAKLNMMDQASENGFANFPPAVRSACQAVLNPEARRKAKARMSPDDATLARVLTTSWNLPHEEGLIEARPLEAQRSKPLSNKYLSHQLQSRLTQIHPIESIGIGC